MGYRGKAREQRAAPRLRAESLTITDIATRLAVDAFLAAGVALHAGEGSETDASVRFTNGDAEIMRCFCARLRRFFAVDEARSRMRVHIVRAYLHQGLDREAAE